MIINIRGTSGSGKTWAVRAAMEHMDPLVVMPPIITEVKGKKRKTIVNYTHYNMQPVYFLGDYTQALCGGTDTIHSQDMICSLVRHFSRFGHVIYEGLLASHLFARYAALYEELTGFGEQFVFCFMDTPFEVCVERVLQRRKDAGNDKPFNSDNTLAKYKATNGCQQRMMNAGYWVEMLDHTQNTGESILALLARDDRPFSESYREESFAKRKKAA